MREQKQKFGIKLKDRRINLRHMSRHQNILTIIIRVKGKLEGKIKRE